MYLFWGLSVRPCPSWSTCVLDYFSCLLNHILIASWYGIVEAWRPCYPEVGGSIHVAGAWQVVNQNESSYVILTKTNQSISSWCHDSVANSYAGGCRTPTRATKAITVQLGLKYVHRNGKYRNLNAFSKTILTHRKIRIPPFLKSILFFKAYVRKAFSNCAKSDALGYMRM